ncbi:hypothetical protein C8J46_11223 [Sphingomonas sp. PP-F2F-A104-K0414]|uniref:hypothetical protein n=1 Tax=Sphingomonas sp. PP-F2F-A104-K0414 TaxID=2135661 RepID=UPI001043EF43|nr:hypothetical protein [Sphingomonas sp. PP-F2F-A104-K0414]TCP95651.1 hypothetical protein C8J46_11223 [Sphingomonas sp. PP-F2F-A104-K0414]
MKFSDLLNKVQQAVIKTQAETGAWRPVGFNFLSAAVTADKSFISEVIIWREPSDMHSYDARFTLFDEREDRYDDPVYVAQISYCSKMDDDPRYLHYVLVKELMHCFDPPDSWTDSADKLAQFLRDLQNKPLQKTNDAISVELKARWMALLALIPPALREYLVAANGKGRRSDELGQELGLLDTIVASALDSYYGEALAQIREDDERPVDEPVPDPNLDDIIST